MTEILRRLEEKLINEFHRLKDSQKRNLLRQRIKVDAFSSEDYKIEIIKHDDKHQEKILTIKLGAGIVSLFSIIGTILSIALPYFL